MIPTRVSWPLVGREDELAWVAAERRAGVSCGVVVSGSAGVGKTRLAREALAEASQEGTHVEWVQATEAAASIPLGAFAALPVDAGARDRLGVLQACAQTLRARGGGQRVVLGVDDAHLLDPTSAALVLHVAATGTAFVVVTVRAGLPCPDPIVALWKDLEASRLELQQLSADETAHLLEEALGGELATDVKRWAYAMSEGHALYLRELVKGALESGALVREGATWQLRSRPSVTPVLVDLISAGLEGLSADELEAVRLLALGEPLQLDIVGQIAGLPAVAGLEERGLATVDARAAPTKTIDVRLSHPLYGEVVRSAMPTVRGNELRTRLAESLRARGLDRRGDALRVAAWLEEAGAPIDEWLLLAAARDANAAGDPALAEHSARRAPQGPEQAVILGTSLALRRRFDEAESVLAEAEGTLETTELAHEYLEWRALRVLHLGLGRGDDARDLLGRADGWFPGEAWRDRVETIRALTLTPLEEGLQAVERLLRREDVHSEDRRRASIARVARLLYTGRTAEAYALSASMRPSLPPRGELDAYALAAWCLVRVASGYDWDEVWRWLLEAERSTEHGSDARVRGEILGQLADAAVWRGKPVTVIHWARKQIEQLEGADPAGRLPLGWLKVVVGSAMRRETEAAGAALLAYEAVVRDTSTQPYWGYEATARAMLLAAKGETSRAAAMLVDTARRGEGYPLDQAWLLHQAFQAGAPPESVSAELDRAAAGTDAPLAAILARLVKAAAARNGSALIESAQTLAELGAPLWAAEAAGLAADAFARAGRQDSARRAQALSSRLLESCEGAWSPLLAALEFAPAELTRREQEIVRLASDGASNAEIAERLVLSVRTVESHLYRAMRKLGVSTREELRTL